MNIYSRIAQNEFTFYYALSCLLRACVYARVIIIIGYYRKLCAIVAKVFLLIASSESLWPAKLCVIHC